MTKPDLRSTFLTERRKLSPANAQQRSEAIVSQIFSFFDFSQINLLHTFLPIRKKQEVDTFLLIERLTKYYPNLPVFVPKANAQTLEMQHFRWQKNLLLHENQWGIPEPVSAFGLQHLDFTGPIVPFQHLPQFLIIVPLLAYDVQGYRVGYGKGFYDRFLAQCPPNVSRVGVSFFEPVDKITDVDIYDIRLDYCITPTKVWVF